MLASQSGIGGGGARLVRALAPAPASAGNTEKRRDKFPSLDFSDGLPVWSVPSGLQLPLQLIGQDARMLYNIGATPLAVACHSELSANRFNYLA